MDATWEINLMYRFANAAGVPNYETYLLNEKLTLLQEIQNHNENHGHVLADFLHNMYSRDLVKTDNLLWKNPVAYQQALDGAEQALQRSKVNMFSYAEQNNINIKNLFGLQ